MFYKKRIEELESKFDYLIEKYPPVCPFKLWDEVEWDDLKYNFELRENVYVKNRGTITEIKFDKKSLRFKYTVTTKDKTYHYDFPIFTVIKSAKKGKK